MAIYEKLSDTEFRETTEVTDTKVIVHSIGQLLDDRRALSQQVARQTKELNDAIAMANAELSKIDVLLAQATKLGVKEAKIIDEPMAQKEIV